MFRTTIIIFCGICCSTPRGLMLKPVLDTSTQCVLHRWFSRSSKKNQWTNNSVIWLALFKKKAKRLDEKQSRCISSNKIKTSLSFTLLNANSKVFHGKYFIQSQCQNSLIFILLLFQLRVFVRHFLIQKIVAPEIYWFLWSKECSIY